MRISYKVLKGEYGLICGNLGGEHVKFQLKGGNIINPFALPKITMQEYETLETAKRIY